MLLAEKTLYPIQYKISHQNGFA